MEFRRKRMLAFTVVGLYMFLGGCDFAIIFPTVWDYLQSLGVEREYWIGFVVSAYSFSGAISGIIGGRLSDKYESHTKSIVLVSSLLMIVGGVQYALGWNVWNLLIARLVCGLGAAAGSALIAQVCRATEIDERTPILAICNAARQCGILFGPVFQLVLEKVNFSMGAFQVNSLNSTGLFMASAWTLFFFYAVFLFYDLTPHINAIQSARNRANRFPIYERSIGLEEDDEIFHRGPSVTIPVSSDQPIVSEILATRQRSISERFFESLGERYNTGEVDLMHTSGIVLMTTSQRYKDEFLTDTFVVLVGMTFTMFFSQVAVEAVVPVIMQNYFGYGIVETSLVFMAGGLEALAVFVGVAFISRYARDTTLLIIGWVLMIVAQVWLMIVIPYFEKGQTDTNPLHLSFYMLGIVLLYMGYPIATTATTGLFSKILSHETQGLGQGIRRVFSYLGLIYGPLWSGASITNAYLALGVPVSILVLNFIMFGFSFRKLDHVEVRHRRRLPYRTEYDRDSNSSLISS